MSALKLGTGFLALSGLLHFVAVVLAGFAADALPLAAFGVLYLVLAWWLNKSGARWLTWVVFFMVMIFSIAALAQIGLSSVPKWVSISIAFADWACAFCLFVVLWRKRVA